MSDEKKTPKKRPTKAEREAVAAEAKRVAEEATKRAAELEAQAATEPPDDEPLTEAQLRADRAREDAKDQGIDVDAPLREIVAEMTPPVGETAEQREARIERLRAVREKYGVPSEVVADATTPDAPRLAALREAIRVAQAEGRRETPTAQAEPPPREAPSDGNGKPPRNGGGNGGDDALPLRDHWEQITKSAVKLSIGGTQFMDDLYPFLKRVMTVAGAPMTQGFVDYPVRLTAAGLDLLSKPLKVNASFREKPQHITPVIKHLMTLGGINVASLHTGVVSRYSQIIWATFVLPSAIAETDEAKWAKKKGGSKLIYPKEPVLKNGEMLPSVMIKAFKGTNDLQKAWRFASTPDKEAAEKNIKESEAERRAEAAADEARRAALKPWKDTAFDIRDKPDVAEIDASLADIPEGETFVAFGFRVAGKLHIKRVEVFNTPE